MRTVHHILAAKGPAVWSVSRNSTVYEALVLMAEKNVGAVPVLDGAALAGIFSERDYARNVILKGKASRDLRVWEVMTSRVVTVSPSTAIEECMRIMTGERVRHLPVVEAGKLSGIVTIGDVVKEIIADQRDTIDHLNGYIVGKG
jgi:CBS domain-containing protein